MLLLASFVVVPLGLGLAVSAEPHEPLHGPGGWPHGLRARGAWPSSHRSPCRPVGTAAVLALPWLAITGSPPSEDSGRLWRGPGRRRRSAWTRGSSTSPSAGPGRSSRGPGCGPLGFPDLIVLMTAVHFHYAGFALPVLAGLAARALGGPAAGAACLGAVAGVPLVAVGITDAQLVPGSCRPRLLELVASGITAASGVLVGLLQIRLAGRAGSPILARALLAVSGLALLVPMGLAWLYALGSFEGVARIEIATMLRYHGAVNALGFAVPGLLAWH